MPSISVSAAGSDPAVTIAIGGLSRCFFNLFVKLPGSASWENVFTSNNAAASSSTFILTSATVGQAAWAVGFSCQFGWSGTFVGDMQDDDQAYSVTISVTQVDGLGNVQTLLDPAFSDAGTFNDPSHSFVGSTTLVVVP